MPRLGRAFLVFKKDWREISRNWQIMAPIFTVPLVFAIVIPAVMVFIPNITSGSNAIDNLQGLENFLGPLSEEIRGMTGRQVMVYVMTLYFFAPLFLIIPIMASSVIASDSFAGEKERKTIEALLTTPLSDSELILGKIAVSFVPAMVTTVIAFALYSAVVDALALPLFGRLLLPNFSWLLLIFGLAPTVSLAAIGLTIAISARVKGFREAQQISGLLLLPVLALVFGQISGAIIFGPLVLAGMIAVFALVDAAAFYLGLRSFRREEILIRSA